MCTLCTNKLHVLDLMLYARYIWNASPNRRVSVKGKNYVCECTFGCPVLSNRAKRVIIE